MLYKRTHFLINKKFQFKFAFYVCTLIFALSTIYPIVIYNIFEYFLQLLSAPQTGQLTLSVDNVKHIENQVLILLGILQLLFLAITFIVTIFLSHRVAGPLFKLRRAMEDVGHGNLDQKITFRKKDYFMELQDTFNEMIQQLSAKRK